MLSVVSTSCGNSSLGDTMSLSPHPLSNLSLQALQHISHYMLTNRHRPPCSSRGYRSKCARCISAPRGSQMGSKPHRPQYTHSRIGRGKQRLRVLLRHLRQWHRAGKGHAAGCLVPQQATQCRRKLWAKQGNNWKLATVAGRTSEKPGFDMQ